MVQAAKQFPLKVDLQQKLDGFTSKCMKKCADMVFKPGNTLEAADKCRKECESPSPISSHLQKPILNDLSDKLAASAKSLYDESEKLSLIAEEIDNYNSMNF